MFLGNRVIDKAVDRSKIWKLSRYMSMLPSSTASQHHFPTTIPIVASTSVITRPFTCISISNLNRNAREGSVRLCSRSSSNKAAVVAYTGEYGKKLRRLKYISLTSTVVATLGLVSDYCPHLYTSRLN
jgi:hypothetical protein